MNTKIICGKMLYRTLGNCFLVGGKIRNFCGKLMLEHCGKHVCICKGAHLSDHISLGDHSGIGENAFLQGTITIGNNVMMARDVKIYTVNHRTTDTMIPMRCQGTLPERSVQIDDDVWIGANVIILPGVHIGKGAVLGAGSVIRQDVPDFAVVIGNPGQIVKYRKNETAPL